MREQLQVLSMSKQAGVRVDHDKTSKQRLKSKVLMRRQAVNLRSQGVSVKEISKRFLVSRGIVYQWLREDKNPENTIMTLPRRLRLKAENKVSKTTSPLEMAKIVFRSGVYLEIPSSSVSGDLIKALCEVE